MKIIYLICIYSLIYFTSCEYKKEKIVGDVLTYDSTNISLDKLKFIKTQDYLTYGDSLVFLHKNVIVKGEGNVLVFVDKLKIFITDLDLNVKKIILLNDKDYFFKGGINDAEIIGNKLFLLDASNIIKTISLNGDIEISEVKLDIKNSESVYTGSFNNLINIANNDILTTNFLLVFNTTVDNNQYELGKLFDLDGEFNLAFKIKSSIGDPIWKNILSDFIYASYYDNKLYFSFLMSKKVYVFNNNGEFLNYFELQVDNKTWFEPNPKNTQSKTGDIETQSVYTKYVAVCNNSLQIKGGFIYSLIYQGEDNKAKLLKYNLSFEKVEEVELNSIPSIMEYKIYLLSDRLFVVYGNIIHIFE